MTGIVTPQIQQDLDEVVHRSEKDLRLLGETDLLLTGATGFVGTWLTLSFLHARRQLGLKGELFILARKPQHLVDALVHSGFEEGYTPVSVDIREIEPNDVPHGANVVHAATPARASLNSRNPLEMLDIILGGQRMLLSAASTRHARRVLFLSSGAVYGRQPLEVERISEDWPGAPDLGSPTNAYHEGKRTAELMGNVMAADGRVDFVTARLFAFLAPFLPQDEHFAAGNFVADAVASRNIRINSGGGSIRSYQYGTDMAVWLWRVLAVGTSGRAYNVGSDIPVTIRDLAGKISEVARTGALVRVGGVDTDANVSRYVPDVSRASEELGLRNNVDLSESIVRTLRWMGEM